MTIHITPINTALLHPLFKTRYMRLTSLGAVALSAALLLGSCSGAGKARRAQERAAEQTTQSAKMTDAPVQVPAQGSTRNADGSMQLPVEQATNFVHANFKQLALRGTVSTNMAGADVQANLQVRMHRDSLLWASVTVFGGVEAVRLLADRNTITVLDRLGGKATTLTYAQMQATVGYPIGLADLQDLLLASPGALNQIALQIIAPGGRPSGPNADVDGDQYGALRGTDTVIAVMNVTGNLLRRVTVKSRNAVAVTRFSNTEGSPLPHARRIYLEADRTPEGAKTPTRSYVLLEYQSMDAPVTPLEYPFSIPAKYERVTPPQR